MTVLLTGVAGFIGYHVCEALLGRGERVVGIDERGGRVIEEIDVAPRYGVAAMGRHLVMVGGKYLQVVDATPFAAPLAGLPNAKPRR